VSVPAESELLHTCLYPLHLRLGAKMVPFAGYAMPVQYPAGVMAEHRHARAGAALFDVSHMGQVRISGLDAAAALESLIPIDVLGLAIGRQRYGYFTNDAGGLLDDLMLTHRPTADGRGSEYFLVINAAGRCAIEESPGQGLLALQGPRAAAALQALLPGVEALRFMDAAWFTLPAPLGAAQVFVSRSGYTGEDGFEISVGVAAAPALADALLQQPDVQPAGLGARDSLRLEAGLCLYGHDMDAATTPVEAALQWAMQKVRRSGGARAGGFPGAAVVLAQLDDPARVARRRVGLLAQERVPVREGAELVAADGRTVGRVSSGSLTPSANAPIAMGYVESALAAPGSEVFALVRGRRVPLRVVAMPFVPHGYARA
jgi:aminomethyltransferase